MKIQVTESIQEQGRTAKGSSATGFAQNSTGSKVGNRNKATEAALALIRGHSNDNALLSAA